METEDEITRTHHELEKDTFSEKSEEVVLPPEEDHREVEATEAQKVIEYEITEKLELTAPTDEDHKISETIKDTTEIKPDTHFPEVTSEEYFEQEALAETQKHEQTEFQEYSEQTAKTLTETSMQSIQTVSYSEIQSEEHLISEYTSESRKIFEDHEVPLTVEPADIPAEVEKSPDIEGLEKSPLDQDLLVETEELSKVQHEPDTVDIEMKGPYLDQDLIEETIEEITRTQPEFGNEEFSEKSEDDGALPDEEDHREVEAIETQKVMEYEITEKLETTAPADDKQEISEMIKDTTEIKPDTHFPEITSEEYFEQEGLTETQKHKQTEFQEFSQQITETLTETSMQSIQTVSYSDIKSEEHLISEYTSESRKEFEDQEVPLTVEPADIPADEAEVEKSPGTEGLEKSPLDQDRLMETEEEITRTKREFEEDKFSEESQEDVESSSEKEQREKEAIDTQRFKEYKVVEKLEPSAPSEEEQELSGVVQVTTETRPEPDEVDFKEVTSEEHSEEIICTSTTLQETFIEESIQEKQDVSVTETDDKFDTVPERDQFLEEHIESTDKASVETMPWQSQEQVEIIRGKEEVSFDEHGSLGESREHISDFDTLQDDAGQDAMVSQQDFDEMATGRVKDMEVDEIIMEPFSFTQKVTVIEHLVTYESPDESGEPADGETESFSEESEDEIIDHTSGFKPTEQPKAEVYHYEMETEDEKVKHEIDILQAEVTEKSPTEVEEIVPIAQTASHISEHVYLEESSREIITVTEQTTTGPCGLEHEGDQVSALEEVSESDTLIDAEQYIDRKETFTLEERSRDVKSPLMKEVIEDKKQETEDETEDIFMDTFIDRKERFLVESRDVLDDSGPAGKGDDAGKDKVDHVIETVHPPDLQYVQQALEEATSDTLQSPVDGMFLALHPPLVPTSSTEVQDRSGTPSDFETDELDAVQEREAIQYTDNEQPVSPTDFSVGSQNTMEESYIVGAADDEMEPEGRITADMSEQIFIEQTIEARKTGADQCYPLDEDDKEERPPSPSEYTLIASQDQDRLARALGVLTAEDASSSNESDDDRPPSPTEYTLIASQDQEALGRAMGLDYPRGDDYIDDEKTFSQDADQLMRADVIGQYQDLLGDQLDEEITCGPNSTQSSEQALMQTLDHSIDNNTMSTLSSEFGDQQQPVEPSAPPPAFNETEEISIIASSYECIYEGMSVETEMHKQQTMEQVIEVGDHFDTKQPDLHLQPIGHSSSYEQLYVEVEEGYQGDSGERLGVEDFHADKAAMLEEKLSSSSSEVAQLEDMLTDQDAEIRETSEEKTEETDVEEQFSPLSKQSSPAKQALNLELDSQKPSFSFSDTSPNLVIATQLEQTCVEHDVLSITNTQLEVGPSPSDQLFSIKEDEIDKEQKHEPHEEVAVTETHFKEDRDKLDREFEPSEFLAAESEMKDKTPDLLQGVEKTDEKYVTELETREEIEDDEEMHEQKYKSSDEYIRAEETVEIEKQMMIPLEPEESVETEQTTVNVAMLDSIESGEELDEESHIEREARLAYMAFDNMGFSAEDAADRGTIVIGAEAAVSKPVLQKQDTKEISPEDLEEKPWQFDFPDDFKKELEQQQETQDELDKLEYIAEKRKYTEEREDYFSSTTETKTTYSVSEEKTIEVSGAQYPSEQESETSMFADAQYTVSSQDTESFLETKDIQEHAESHDFIPSRVSEHESEIRSEESCQQAGEPLLSATDIVQDVEAQEGSEHDDEEQDESSSESSTDRDTEVFDEKSGTYVKIPWEVAHQFKRQFSESLIEQEKKLFQTVQSIDMGSFYRRDQKEASEYPSVSFIDTEESSDTRVHTDEKKSETILAKTKHKVTFQLSESEIVEQPTIEKCSVPADEDFRDESSMDAEASFEPHDMIEQTHEAEVIFTILESRQYVKEELARRDEDVIDDSEYFVPAKDFDEGEYVAQASPDIYTEARAQAMLSPTEDMMASFVTAKSSLETSLERSFEESQLYMESRSTRYARDDSVDSVGSKADEDLFPEQAIPMSVVSKESRLAQQELLQEMGDEKDRSVSPSVDSEELSTTYESQAELQEELGTEMQSSSHTPSKFPMAVHSLGKALADNEIYESSETERDSTEEKLSPIEEAPTGETIEEIGDEQSPKSMSTEKRVTFQTDTLFARTQELHGGEDVKTSTSSSEVSMEPTLLAASYDLDTGHVSHVVAAYDISPDSVEKQTAPETTTKAILSSPEDDVFETDASMATPTDSQPDVIMTSSKESSSDLYPSPPASTPKDSSITDTGCDLESASSRLEQLQTEQMEEEAEVESKAEGEDLVTLTESVPDDQKVEEDELSSPFEMMSPSELTGVGLPTEVTPTSGMITSLESATSSSSYVDVQVDLYKVEDQKVAEGEGEECFDEGKQETVSLPNGPTEVEYIAEYDGDKSEQVCEPSAVEDVDLMGELEEAQLPVEEKDIAMSTDDLPQPVCDFTKEESEISDVERDVTLTRSMIEELRVPAGSEHLTSSEQTLYGFEMPYEETGAMSASLSLKESTGTLEIDQDSDFTQPPTEITLQTDETLTEQGSEGREAPSEELPPGIQLPVEFQEDAEPEKMITDNSSPEIEPHLSRSHQEYELDQQAVYPGKRALEILGVAGGIVSEYATDMLGTEEQQQYFSASDSDDGLDEYIDKTESDFGLQRHEERVEYYEYEERESFSKEEHLEQTELIETRTKLEEETEDQTDPQVSDFAEKPEDELIGLEDSKPESEVDENEPPPLFVDVEHAGQLDISGYQDDLERPISPTPDALRQTYFGDDQPIETSDLTTAEEEILEKAASEFVESILDDVKLRVQDETADEESDDDVSDEEEPAVAPDFDAEDKTDESDTEVEETEPPPSVPPPLSLFRKQVSEDIPEITITQHLHEEKDEGDYPLFYANEYSEKCVPEEADEEPDDTFEEVSMSSKQEEPEPKQSDEDFYQDTTDHKKVVSSSTSSSDYMPESGSFLVEIDSGSTPTVFEKEEHEVPVELEDKQVEAIEVESGSKTPEEELTPPEECFELADDLGEIKVQDISELMSPEDLGDSSSVDSFATVVAAQAEDEDDQDQVDEEQDDRLADIASMTSSFHSDLQPTHTEDTGQEDAEEEDDETEEMLEWPQPPYERDRDRESESSVDSDRYEFVDRTALSVITEMSDEDRFEMIERDEVLSEGGMSDHVQSSPDGPQQSPGVNNFKFFGKSAEKDDVSVSSSLLEFENLEREIAQSNSVSSIEIVDKESLAGSLEDKKSVNKNVEKDDASITSSLAEFERLERDIAVSGSFSSVDKVTPESKSSNGTGSISSLNEFERLEHECVTDSEERRSSFESSSRQSDTSSHASLAEFEQIEREIKTAEELEAEAQKIVSILESGSLFAPPTRGAEIDKDSLDGRESLDQDSLSEGDKVHQGDADSLDGDTSEMTDMTSSVIFAGPDLSVTHLAGEPVLAREVDTDSLQGEAVMQLSSDSLTLEQKSDQLRQQSEKYDADSLHEQEGVMDRSADSIELQQQMESSADSIELEKQLKAEVALMERSSDSLELQQNIMDRSSDSLELDQQQEQDTYDRDSLQGQEEVMQTSTDSLELPQNEDKQSTVMQMSVESAAWSMGSSGFSRSSEETLRSESHSDSSHSHDLMQVSAESAELKSRTEHGESKVIEESYKQESQKKRGFIKTTTTTVLHSSTDPFFESEKQYKTYHKEEKFHFDLDEESSKNPFLTQGPYQEKKKVFTMTEWEALKEAKKQGKQNGSDTSPTEQTSTSPSSQSVTVSAFPSCPPTSISQAPCVGQTPETTHYSRAKGEEDVYYEDPDDSDGDSVDSPTASGGDGDHVQSTRLMMKKEIHKKTVIGMDGNQETFIKEESQIQQDNEPPEELRGSMQEIIDQFMESEPQVPQIDAKLLEDDV